MGGLEAKTEYSWPTRLGASADTVNDTNDARILRSPSDAGQEARSLEVGKTLAFAGSKRQPVFAGLAAILFVAAAIVLYSHYRSAGPGAGRTDWNAYLQCGECGNKFSASVKLTYPIKAQLCPKCGKEAAWDLKHCTKCKKDFLPERSGDPPRPPAIPKCPTCGSAQYVTSLLPDGTLPQIPETIEGPK